MWRDANNRSFLDPNFDKIYNRPPSISSFEISVMHLCVYAREGHKNRRHRADLNGGCRRCISRVTLHSRTAELGKKMTGKRAAEHRQDVTSRPDPVEGRLGRHATAEERAEPASHVSEIVAAGSARYSKAGNVTVGERDGKRGPSPDHRRAGPHTRPRRHAAVRSANHTPVLGAAPTRSAGSMRGQRRS